MTGVETLDVAAATDLGISLSLVEMERNCVAPIAIGGRLLPVWAGWWRHVAQASGFRT
jgi:hypothetical protein